MVENGKFDLGSYVRHKFALDDIDQAINLFLEKHHGVFMVAIKP